MRSAMQVAGILAVLHPGRVTSETIGSPGPTRKSKGINMIHSYLPWHHPIGWGSRPWLQDVDRAATYTDAATRLLDSATAVLTTYEIEAGMRKVLGRLTDLKMLDSVLNIGWNVGSTFRLSRPGNSPRCRVVLADPPHRLHWVAVADDGLAVSVEFSISPDEVGGTILTHTKTMLRHGAVAAPPTGMRHYR
jgi:hypothetical protein